MANKEKKWTPEEIEKARKEHRERKKASGTTMDEDEWNALMNYYDDKAIKDETFEEYRNRTDQ